MKIFRIPLEFLILGFIYVTGCTKPIYLEGKTEYIEKVVTKDTTIYLEVERDKVAAIAQDSSFLEVKLALSFASVDSLGNLHHTLEQKAQKIEKEVQIIEKIVTVRDSIPYPQIVEVEKKRAKSATIYKYGFFVLIALVLWRLFRFIR